MAPTREESQIARVRQDLRNVREQLNRARAAKTIEASVKRKHFEAYKAEKTKTAELRRQIDSLKGQLDGQMSVSVGSATVEVAVDAGPLVSKADPEADALKSENNRLSSQLESEARAVRDLNTNILKLNLEIGTLQNENKALLRSLHYLKVNIKYAMEESDQTGSMQMSC